MLQATRQRPPQNVPQPASSSDPFPPVSEPATDLIEPSRPAEPTRGANPNPLSSPSGRAPAAPAHKSAEGAPDFINLLAEELGTHPAPAQKSTADAPHLINMVAEEPGTLPAPTQESAADTPDLINMFSEALGTQPAPAQKSTADTPDLINVFSEALGTQPAPAQRSSNDAPNFMEMLPDELALRSDRALQTLAHEVPSASALLSKEDVIVQGLERRMAKLTIGQRAILRTAGPVVARAVNQGYSSLLDTLVEHTSQRRPLTLEHPHLAQLAVNDAMILRLLCKEAGSVPTEEVDLQPHPSLRPAAQTPTKPQASLRPAAQTPTQMAPVAAVKPEAADRALTFASMIFKETDAGRCNAKQSRFLIGKSSLLYAEQAHNARLSDLESIFKRVRTYSHALDPWNACSHNKVSIALSEHYFLALLYAWAQGEKERATAAQLALRDTRPLGKCVLQPSGEVSQTRGRRPAVFQRIRGALMRKSGTHSNEEIEKFHRNANVKVPLHLSRLDDFVAMARARDPDTFSTFKKLWVGD